MWIRKRGSKAPRRKAGRGRRAYKRNNRGTSQIFSENVFVGSMSAPVTPAGGALSTGTGGVYAVKFNYLPQWTNYQQLYNQFKIMKVKYTFLPRFNSFDPCCPLNLDSGEYRILNARIVTAIQDTPSLQTLTSENNVLTMNGSVVRSVTRPFYITHRPKPIIEQYVPGGGSVGAQVSSRSQMFINFDGNASHPEQIDHAGVAFWVTVNGDGPAAPDNIVTLYDVYAKITFVCRDPR